tara:strand:- start:993 stop:1319 length:327 start_codon:yes stop_codon:yes gene_type:complete
MSDDQWRKLVFYETTRNSIELKIRLRYDSISQGLFFRSLIDRYIAGDPRIIEIVSEVKENSTSMGKRNIKNSTSEITQGKDFASDLGLSDQERQKIYDILETGDWDWE